MKSFFAKYQLSNHGLHDVVWKPGTPKHIKEAYRGFIKEQNAKYLRSKNKASTDAL
jgi:hypothetical protein